MNHVHLFPAYRGLMDVDKAQADSLCRYGVKTCHIMGYIVGQKGGYDALGFTREDLYNYFDSLIHAQIKDGDIVASLSYLDEMPDTDPMLYGKFTTTTNGKLKHFFWADGHNRSVFLCFNDVLTFDSTYKKNK